MLVVLEIQGAPGPRRSVKVLSLRIGLGVEVRVGGVTGASVAAVALANAPTFSARIRTDSAS